MEYVSEYREQIIELIYQIYFLKFCKPKNKDDDEKVPRLKVFGVSSKQLQEYCTSDKDIYRRINRMPNDEFALDVMGDGTVQKPETNPEDMEGLE